MSPKLVMEEAPESYKDVTDVINTCHAAGISQKSIKSRPSLHGVGKLTSKYFFLLLHII